MDEVSDLTINILYLTNKPMDKINANTLCFWKGIKTISGIEKLIQMTAYAQIDGSGCF